MTTKPRAKKFRIRRTGTQSTARVAARGQEDATFDARDDRVAGPTPLDAARRMNPLEDAMQDGTEDGFPAEGFATAGRRAPMAAADAAQAEGAATADRVDHGVPVGRGGGGETEEIAALHDPPRMTDSCVPRERTAATLCFPRRSPGNLAQSGRVATPMSKGPGNKVTSSKPSSLSHSS